MNSDKYVGAPFHVSLECKTLTKVAYRVFQTWSVPVVCPIIMRVSFCNLSSRFFFANVKSSHWVNEVGCLYKTTKIATMYGYIKLARDRQFVFVLFLCHLSVAYVAA